jgi:broad specificity phosphatase PhoE
MTKASHFTIVLLRSCSTSWDSESRLCGATDLPATDESIDELSRILHESSDIAPLRAMMDSVLCGPSDVSMESARLLVGTTETKIRTIDDLAEVNLGLWEGVRREDLEERFPSVYSQWIEQPGTVAPPDGESLEEVQDRVLGVLFSRLLKLKSEHPVVGLVLRPYAWSVLKCWLDQRPLSEVWGYLEGGGSVESFSLDRAVIDANRTQKPKIA